MTPEVSNISSQCIDEFVEGILKRQKSFIPAVLGKPILNAVTVVMLIIVEEVFVDFRVNLIGARVRYVYLYLKYLYVPMS
jgi:hypothetical protein